MCLDLIKYAENMSKVVVTDMDTALLNVAPNVFPKSIDLVCRLHISKIVRATWKTEAKSNDPKW